jgi:transglutaminase-like putative cysteine protease
MNLRVTVAAATATILASTALYPLLNGGLWFWTGIGAVIVVAAIGAATRRRSIPPAVCFLAAVAGLFLYLNLVFAHAVSWAHILPNGASLHYLRELVAQARAEIRHAPPPVPERPGIVLLTVGGIGLVGALTDVLAVRLHRPAIAGLPLLVLFCVPLATDARPSAVGGVLVFCAGVIGYLGLLSADGRHRLRLWGRHIQPWQDASDSDGPDTRPLAAAGRRIGSAAVVIALFLPLLLPGLKVHRLFPGTGSGGGGGAGYGGRVFFPHPLDEMNIELHEQHPETILTYHTTDPEPPYLQIYVLGRLNTDTWTMAPPASPTALTKGHLPQAPGLLRTTEAIPVHEVISLSPSLPSGNGASVAYLPLPYPTRQVDVSGDWRVDPSTLTVLATGAKLGGLRYTVNAEDPNPSPQQLRYAGLPPDDLTYYESVPPAFQSLRRLAYQITAGRTTAYGRAVALQDWFTNSGKFQYSLNVPQTDSPDALKQFLTVPKDRRGYCQQFAFAMAVLARLLHIPSRVVVGYTQGTPVATDTWQVKTSDAHAWPELYFNGAGWLRFEPTPGDASGVVGQATASPPPYSLPQASVTGLASQSTGSRTQTSPRTGATAPAGSKVPAGKLRGGLGQDSTVTLKQHSSPAPVAALVIGFLVVVLMIPAITRVVSRRRRWWEARDDAARAHVAWRELHDDLTDHRIPCPASESPRARVHRVTRSLHLAGPEREALDRVGRAEERASYASAPVDSAALKADVALVRRAVVRSCGRGTRWSARVFPASALVPLRAGLQHVLDVFGWMDLATARARNRAAPRRGTPADSKV